ncbi:hypothetical protein FF011L_28870 [Roseimaritima multifibrata]|uniref:Collagen-binding domain-containing protein n=1 Tax=Roseimaritima multifibrata TaxID=1930274 RepID=A0A517MGV4_9BACT|nr:hypothetical protein [Roseimaritima multifibrata]QDS94109.1 hypothetical protein FF011L_28870 [Roseimaritima multifibrata]
MFRSLNILLCFSYLALLVPASVVHGEDRIHPSSRNPFYWEYKGENVLLVGGSVEDNLFQIPDLQSHLDEIKSVGANYIRNTMSDRHDEGYEVYPYAQGKNGKYDLESWNEEYWTRFENMLKWTAERDIIVQIELWDRFDYSTKYWPPNPYNPVNNVNYNEAESGLAKVYPRHPGTNEQPFFFTTPKQRDNNVVLKYQRKFVDKILSHTLKYGHVLYCIDNETNGEEAWSTYWAEYIRAAAAQADRSVCITEMWDDWNLSGPHHQRTIAHPERYDFIDVSQNNHQKGQKHWDNFQSLRSTLLKQPRPINTVKTYGADNNKFGHTSQDGVSRLWRHIVGGAASARFHRPDSGLGLSDPAKGAIKACRKLETLVALWDLTPGNQKLSNRGEDEAYLAAQGDKVFVVYFPQGGSVDLAVANPDRTWTIKWINIDTGEWGPTDKQNTKGRAEVSLKAPGKGNWCAVVK